MLIVVYFDDFYKNIIRKLHNLREHYSRAAIPPKKLVEPSVLPYKLVHYTKIPINIKPSALIITGSKKRILREPPIPELDKLIQKTSGPVIGICYGFQYLARLSGGTIKENDAAYRGIKSGHHYNHYDKVVALPKSWTVLEKEDDFISVAKCKNWIGYQFHPEYKQLDFDKYIVSII